MSQCIGVIGVINKSPKATTPQLNEAISTYREIVIGRMGVPKHDENVGLISLIVEGKTEKINEFEQTLKSIEGLMVSMVLSVC